LFTPGNAVYALKSALVFLPLAAVSAFSAVGQTVTGEMPHPAAMQALQSPTGLTAHNDREVLEVTVCGDSMVHVVARPAGAPSSTAPRPWMLAQAQSCPGSSFQFSQSGDWTTLTTSRLTVSLSAREGSLSFKNIQGEALLRENGGLPRTYIPAQTTAIPFQSTALYQVEDRFSPDATEAIYGLGQHQSGLFNYRGSTLELGQNNTDVAIPLLVSSKGYGILWNTASFTYVDNRFPLDLNFESMASDQVDYYVLYGPDMDRIIHEYRSMTGHAPLFPQWAYGFFQSKDRYASQAEILDIANQYRSRHIPLDAIVQDWFWWKPGGEGDPEFNSGYTDVPAELKALHDEHVHAMISVWGMMDASSKNFKEIQRQGLRFRERTSTTRPIPRRATSSGINLRASCSRRDGMLSGWTARSRRSTGRTGATRFCAISSCISAAAWNSRTFFRWSTPAAFKSTGSRRPGRSASFC
jgi:alpha-D-xyloside xylohydrolase